MEIPVLLALFMGLRRGEILGLRFCNVDFSINAIRIEDQAEGSDNDEASLAAPKSDDGFRTIPIPARLLKLLGAVKTLLIEGGVADIERAFVCYDANGRLTASKLDKQYKHVIIAAGLSKAARLHDARHTAATNMLYAGIPLKLISYWLGHASIGSTADTYQHVYKMLEHMPNVIDPTVFRDYVPPYFHS